VSSVAGGRLLWFPEMSGPHASARSAEQASSADSAPTDENCSRVTLFSFTAYERHVSCFLGSGESSSDRLGGTISQRKNRKPAVVKSAVRRAIPRKLINIIQV
jgi:hypothetical protein